MNKSNSINEALKGMTPEVHFRLPTGKAVIRGPLALRAMGYNTVDWKSLVGDLVVAFSRGQGRNVVITIEEE